MRIDFPFGSGRSEGIASEQPELPRGVQLSCSCQARGKERGFEPQTYVKGLGGGSRELERWGERERAQRVTPRELSEVPRQPQVPDLKLRLQRQATTEVEHPSQADLQVHSEEIVRLSV